MVKYMGRVWSDTFSDPELGELRNSEGSNVSEPRCVTDCTFLTDVDRASKDTQHLKLKNKGIAD